MNPLRAVLHVLRADPDQWRRRGLRSPREIAVLVAERSLPDDPSYRDFFVPSP
ncbi:MULTISPECIES: hypothetical protein [unclassified Curtobacterium]|uniref:hypothetical protein n=1 Tax=unclassified Curtobacterium TaxID=257496 RepID=UPI0015871DED|nr:MULTISPECIES: hypothetical protein [unclassified Curtobacterium]MCT9619986.1 hypothetical protein [Curtobacterium sp. C2H10]MDR6574813.1 hypothetical protein [Curtobacterium sp. 320]